MSDDELHGRLIESLPDAIVASLDVRDAWRKQAAAEGGLESVTRPSPYQARAEELAAAMA